MLLSSNVSAYAKVNFERSVLPILKENCFNCHRAPYKLKGRIKKPKGNLRLDSRLMILKGNDKKKILVAGSPRNSPLYHLTTLHKDDESVMPPKGDLLTKAEQRILFNWISEGADFGNWEGAPVKSEELEPARDFSFPKIHEQYKALSKSLKNPSLTAVQNLMDSGAIVMRIYKDSPALYLSLRPCDKKIDLSSLKKISLNIIQADFRNQSSPILESLKNMKNLQTLNLSGTFLSKESILALGELKELKTLNLSNAKFENKIQPDLTPLKKLKIVYALNSDLSLSNQQYFKIVKTAELPSIKQFKR